MAKNKSVKTMVGFVQAIANFWTRYLDFMGHATRSEYWFGILFSVFVIGIASCLDNFAILGGALVVLFIPIMSLTIRRFRDAGISVWYYIFPMLIIFGAPFVLPIASDLGQYGDKGYISSLLYLYFVFIEAFGVFNFVVACLPSRK